MKIEIMYIWFNQMFPRFRKIFTGSKYSSTKLKKVQVFQKKMVYDTKNVHKIKKISFFKKCCCIPPFLNIRYFSLCPHPHLCKIGRAHV